MPLPLPNLDDRRWADLVDEGRALVPRYAPRWTDHNLSDPGITLIELFAWMTESSLYRLNRVTARHQRKFLALVGQSPEPPRPASTMIQCSPASGAASFELPPGVEFETPNSKGHAVPFRTLRAVNVADVRLVAVQVDEGQGIVDRTVEWRNGLAVRVFGSGPAPDAAVYFGFDAIPAQEAVSLAVRWDRAGEDAAARAAQSADERAALIEEQGARVRGCRKPLPNIACAGAVPIADPAVSTPPHHSARVVWEVFTGVWTPLMSVTPPASLAPGQIADDTRSLTLDGLVEVNLPAAVVKSTQGQVATLLVYLRCRLTAGAYDSPPALLDVVPNAVPAVQAIALSQRFTIPAAVVPVGGLPAAGSRTGIGMTVDNTGQVKALAFVPSTAGLPHFLVISIDKAIGMAGHLTLDLVLAGQGTGLPDQVMTLPTSPIVTDLGLAIYSHDGLAWQRWETRSDHDASTRLDWHCTLDRTTGVLGFGNGERGRVVPAGHAVFATGRTTMGAAATVPVSTRMRLSRSPGNTLLLMPFSAADVAKIDAMAGTVWPACGGADAESLAHASGRAAERLHAHERLVELAREGRARTLDQIERAAVRGLPTPSNAINVLDLERIALDVPGTRVARARAWPGIHATYPCLSAPGAVTLVIVPDLPAAQPQPSAGLLRAVAQHIDRRRTVTMMVAVVGPIYVSVTVNATVQLRRGAGAVQVRSQIIDALNRFLDPRTGGPEHLGWPFGRDVYRAEILQLIDGVPGVDHVLDLSISTPGGSPQCGNLSICPTSLASSGPHQIVVE